MVGRLLDLGFVKEAIKISTNELFLNLNDTLRLDMVRRLTVKDSQIELILVHIQIIVRMKLFILGFVIITFHKGLMYT